MAIRNIVTIGNDALRQTCKEVTEFDDRLGELIDDMIQTMFSADGVGLAAPQVGILKRIAVVCTDGSKVYELVNPKIIHTKGKQVGVEGCLSVPGRSGRVERPAKVTVSYQDRYGEHHIAKADHLTCVAFCHEIDHLDGILYIDKVIPEL